VSLKHIQEDFEFSQSFLSELDYQIILKASHQIIAKMALEKIENQTLTEVGGFHKMEQVTEPRGDDN
jgi:hypothetical protein